MHRSIPRMEAATCGSSTLQRAMLPPVCRPGPRQVGGRRPFSGSIREPSLSASCPRLPSSSCLPSGGLAGVGPNGTPKAERRPSGCQNAEEIEACLPPSVTPDSSALPGAAPVGRTQLAPETGFAWSAPGTKVSNADSGGAYWAPGRSNYDEFLARTQRRPRAPGRRDVSRNLIYTPRFVRRPELEGSSMRFGRSSHEARLASRSLPLAIALAVLVSLILPTALAQSQGQFAPPHSDAGVDTTADGLFEFLQVNASVNVTDAGSYNIQGGLFDPFGGPISFVGVTASLSPGIQSVALDFSGIQIYSHGVDGPYRVDLTAYDASFRFLDSDTHTTAAYAYTDFDQPTLRFAPPHSDAGVDTDGDGRFNVLRISVRVNATEAGSYTIIGTLYDPFFGFIDTAATTVPLGVGEQTVALDFAGWKVRQHGVDGTYTASLNAFDASGQPMDSDTYTTQAYQALDFDTPPAALAPPHSDAGVDRDGDGLYNAIDVNVSLAVDEAGTYRLSATLYDSTLTISLGFASTTVDLGTGPENASLEFSTIPMVANAIDGPYVATISLLTSDFDLLDSGTHTTAAYTVSQFDPLPAQFQPPHSDRGIDRDVPADGVYNVLEVDVNVSVTEPGVFELAGNLYDPNGSFLITQAVWFGTLSVGPHTLPLFFS